MILIFPLFRGNLQMFCIFVELKMDQCVVFVRSNCIWLIPYLGLDLFRTSTLDIIYVSPRLLIFN